jgi:hypothetical protein
MTLLALLLGAREVTLPETDSPPPIDYPLYGRDSGLRCPNPRCVSIQTTEIKYLKSKFKIVSHQPLTMRCVYCEHGFEPKYVASAEWHEGKLDTKKYHNADSHWTKTIKPENLIVFNTEDEARAFGFRPNHDMEGHH